MLGLWVYALLFILTAGSSVVVFLENKLLYAVIALTITFFSSALVFLALNQVIIALLQLLIFVGGLSTYLIVAVATEEKGKKLMNIGYFIATTIILTVALSILLQFVPQQTNTNNTDFLSLSTTALQNDYPLLYVMILLLFGSAVGTILVVKKFAKLLI